MNDIESFMKRFCEKPDFYLTLRKGFFMSAVFTIFILSLFFVRSYLLSIGKTDFSFYSILIVSMISLFLFTPFFYFVASDFLKKENVGNLLKSMPKMSKKKLIQDIQNQQIKSVLFVNLKNKYFPDIIKYSYLIIIDQKNDLKSFDNLEYNILKNSEINDQLDSIEFYNVNEYAKKYVI